MSPKRSLARLVDAMACTIFLPISGLKGIFRREICTLTARSLWPFALVIESRKHELVATSSWEGEVLEELLYHLLANGRSNWSVGDFYSEKLCDEYKSTASGVL
jgi:hypothetical protein